MSGIEAVALGALALALVNAFAGFAKHGIFVTLAALALVVPAYQWRWQLAPAVLAFIVIAVMGRTRYGHGGRMAGAATATPLLLIAVFLATQFPMVVLPKPTGPYDVGTRYTWFVDESRVERYDPTRNRELAVQIWYPARTSSNGKYQTLFHEAYRYGPIDELSLVFGYLRNVPTSSVIDAEVSSDGPFPVILFNHGLYLPADSNVLLMEHLASHGYVVASVSHTYESLKPRLSHGPVPFELRFANDVGFSNEEVNDGGIGDRIGEIRGRAHSELMTSLYSYLDQFVNMEEPEQRVLVATAIRSPDLSLLQPTLTEDHLYDFFQVRSAVRNASTHTWTKDLGSLLDVLRDLVPFGQQLDLSLVGVTGFSYGGSAAGEFCKTDLRCRAGTNLDGTQFGENWKSPVPVPFLMLYSNTSPASNDYAYFPASNEFHELLVQNAKHVDLIDSIHAFPILKTAEIETGQIEMDRMTQLVNDIQLGFFDEHLKGITGAYDTAVSLHSKLLTDDLSIQRSRANP